MKIVIAGFSGLIGNSLVEHLHTEGHELILLTRSPESVSAEWHEKGLVERWAPPSIGTLVELLDGVDAVINLAGAPIDRRWTDTYKTLLWTSRIDSTKALVNAMAKCKQPPKVFACASAIGFYDGYPIDSPMITENDSKGTGFISDLCDAWEKEAQKALLSGTRVVNVRIGLVLTENGGMISKIKLPFILGVGGHIGTGKQWCPWVHIDDVVGIFEHVIKTESVQGPVHAVAPEVVSFAQFCKEFAKQLNRWSLFHVSSFVLKLVFGEMSSIMLNTPPVGSTITKQHHYEFKYSALSKALNSILVER